MAIDSEILESAIKSDLKTPVFRLYGWSPACVSLGRNQKSDCIDENFLRENGFM